MRRAAGKCAAQDRRRKKSVRPTSTKGGKEPEVGEANVLRFVHDREIEHNFIILRDHDCPRHRRD
jgi:hypothetical protein